MASKIYKYVSLSVIIVLILIIILLMTNNSKEEKKYESWINQEDRFITTIVDVGKVKKSITCETIVNVDESSYKSYKISKKESTLNVKQNQVVKKDMFLDTESKNKSDVFGRIISIEDLGEEYEIIISDFSKLSSVVCVEQKYSSYISIGQDVEIVVDDITLSGTVINHSYQIIDGYLLVDIVYASDDVIYEGSTASVNILLEEREDVLCVYKSSLIQENNAYYLNVLIDGIVSKTQVKVGLIGDEMVQIYTGVKKGTTVVINDAE